MKLQDIGDIIVGGLVIEVNSPTADLINNGLLGHYLPAQLEIGVRNDLPLQLQANVITHEVTHAIANVYCEGLGLNEAQVAGLAQGFYQVLTDNPDLVKFMVMREFNEAYTPLEKRDMDTIMNGHVKSPETVVLGHEFDDH
tara:strand:+ start:357 stop:779 length:423 start_codon:yes stop_codon:yes gene_type:complete